MTALVLAASCKKPNFDVAPSLGSVGTISNYLSNNFDLSLFFTAVKKAGLADSLDRTDATYTVWAPLNSALNKDSIYNPSDFDKWSPDSLKYFVRTHILPRKLFYSDIPATSDNKYTNLNGIDLYISKTTNAAMTQLFLIVDGVPVLPAGALSAKTGTQYGATQLNGVVYPLNNSLKVIRSTVQGFLSSRQDLSHLVTGLKKFGLWDKLSGDGPFTIVAPQDTAFERYGLTTDSILRLDPAGYDIGLFGGYCMAPSHVFLVDVMQLNGQSLVSFHTLSDSLDLTMGVSSNSMTLMSSCLKKRYSGSNPQYIGPGSIISLGVILGSRFLGETQPAGVYFITYNSLPFGRYINYACSNGVVHLLSTILARPSDVTK